jgi:transcriptional/translational regulatory protein YebC/TACO1
MTQPTFPLIVHDDEREVLRTALEAYRADFGHDEQQIVGLVDEVLAAVPADEHVALDLDAATMKVTYGALHALLEDSVRTQHDERQHLRALLERLPGEHDVRAIDLDTELARRGGTADPSGTMDG